MKVLFVQDVTGTADAGEVKEVKNGFARNYLLPRKLAVAATPSHLQRIQHIQREAEDTRLKLSKDAKKVAEAMDGRTITVEVRVGPTGRLFGSVTGRRIAEEVRQLTDMSVDHRSILLGAAIHEPGDYDVTVRLYREVTSQLKLRVVPEGYVKEEAQRAEAGAVETAEPSDQPEAETVPE